MVPFIVVDCVHYDCPLKTENWILNFENYLYVHELKKIKLISLINIILLFYVTSNVSELYVINIILPTTTLLVFPNIIQNNSCILVCQDNSIIKFNYNIYIHKYEQNNKNK